MSFFGAFNTLEINLNRPPVYDVCIENPIFATMNYRRLVILLMLFIMAFPIVYSAVYHDKAVYSLFSDEEKTGDGEDVEKDCKDEVSKCFQNFFAYSINNNASLNNQLLPLNHSEIPTEHFAKVQSPPPDFI